MTELKKLGRYEIVSEIGRGGMSVVYLAHDPLFDRKVILKLLPREFLHDPTFKSRFERESKAIARLEHASIVPVYDFGEEAGLPYLVMRYMTGGSLADRLQKGPLTLDEALRIMTRLTSALEEAHQRGMIHRDIKPGNVLFDHYGDAFLADFGIVKLTQETSTFTAGGFIGTPAYMSPEQARGDADIDARSDVYALGAMFFEMLTGKPPYQSETVMGLALKHINDPIPSILALKPDLPEGLEEYIQKSMCKERQGRYESVKALASALHAIVSKETGPAIADREPLPETVVSEGEGVSTIIEAPDRKAPQIAVGIPEAPTPKRKMPRRWLAIGLGGAGLIIVVVMLAFLIPKLGPFSVGSVPTATATKTPTNTPLPTAAPKPTIAAMVELAPPSPRVGAFYYPCFGNPKYDRSWIGWEGPDLQPPLDIASDYYPLLGPYSRSDPIAIGQHFAWLKEAGIGVVISSWWGIGSDEDEAVPLLLEMGQRHGIKIAFHIEPYPNRSADQLVEDVRYLYDRYGENPAFFRTRASSRFSNDDRDKGLIFIRSIERPNRQEEPVDAEYWRAAIDAIHELPDGALVIGNTTKASSIDAGHFDGVYNYVAFDLEVQGAFHWALDLPPDSWYVPSVMPGFWAERVNHPVKIQLPRMDGETYHAQWDAALGVGVQPQMVTINSFNSWHEGSQIEPAAPEKTNERGHEYMDYRPLSPDSYLVITREWADRLDKMEWSPMYRARIRMTSSSDWANLSLIEGGMMTRPRIIERSEEAGASGLDNGILRLIQEIELAEGGNEVFLVIDVLFTHLNPQGELVFRLEKGHLGKTEVQLMNYAKGEPIPVEIFRWGEGHDQLQFIDFVIPALRIIEPPT